MKFLKTYFVSALLTIMIFASCNSINCESKKIGDVPRPDFYTDYVVHENGDIVSYENEDEEQISFTIEDIPMEGRFNQKEIGTQRDLQNGSYSCYEYLSTPGNLLQFLNDDPGTYLKLQSFTISEADTLDYLFIISCSSSETINNEPTNESVQVLYSITKDAFIDMGGSNIERLDEWEAQGKTFYNVFKIQGQLVDAYFSRGVGIAGFKRVDGKLWTIVE